MVPFLTKFLSLGRIVVNLSDSITAKLNAIRLFAKEGDRQREKGSGLDPEMAGVPPVLHRYPQNF